VLLAECLVTVRVMMTAASIVTQCASGGMYDRERRVDHSQSSTAACLRRLGVAVRATAHTARARGECARRCRGGRTLAKALPEWVAGLWLVGELDGW
jgi:hypothetical protein